MPFIQQCLYELSSACQKSNAGYRGFSYHDIGYEGVT